MNRRQFLLSTGALLGVGTVASTSAWALHTSPKIKWHNNLKSAYKVARAQDKPLLILFSATWCTYCHKLIRESLGDKKMVAFVEQRFIPVLLDFDKDNAIAKDSLAHLDGVSSASVIDNGREHRVAEGYREKLRIRCSGVDQKTLNLSGGNQQKVVLSKWLFTDPEVLILDEPTRGIDVGAKYEIYTLIAQLAAEGKCVIVISSEMPELLGITDRIYVMNEGRFIAEMPTAEASQERIMRAIVKAS